MHRVGGRLMKDEEFAVKRTLRPGCRDDLSMRKHRALGAVLVAGLVAGLTACTPSPESGPTQSTTPASTPAAPSPEPSRTGDAGPSPMPASDGGPMLWPTTSLRTVYLEGWTTEQLRYGFVDTRGELVVPPRYDWYQICRDADGRASLVLAGSGEEQSDVLDLSGQVIGHVPGRFAGCIGDTHADFQTEVSELGPADVGNGLIDLRSGQVVIEVRKGRVVTMVDRRTVNVHQADGEYFLDLVTGERTPHPGYLTGYLDPQADPADLALLPASNVPIDTYTEPVESPLLGYLDRDGAWALEPALAQAEPFHAGYAVVSAGGTAHFIDTGFQRTDGDWAWITDQGWGYTVAEGSDAQPRIGLLGLDLRVILEPTDAEVSCLAEDVCEVYPASGPPRALLLPEGVLTDPPEGFGTVLSRTLFSDATREVPATRIRNTATGTTFALARPSGCELREPWLLCYPATEGAPPAVYGTDGQPTPFRDVVAIEGAVAGTDSGYHWAVAGREQGFIDNTGNWRYRESRYTDLED